MDFFHGNLFYSGEYFADFCESIFCVSGELFILLDSDLFLKCEKFQMNCRNYNILLINLIFSIDCTYFTDTRKTHSAAIYVRGREWANSTIFNIWALFLSVICLFTNDTSSKRSF